MSDTQKLLRRIRLLLMLFIIGLVVSGLTAFPLAWEVNLLNRLVNILPPTFFPALAAWIGHVNQGLQETYRQYPFMAYGTDWLAFAHLVIAIAFLGPLRDPIRNVWVIEFGMIACLLVIPLALIMGPLRGIPPFWRLIDCSFGIIGIIPLWLSRRMVTRLVRAMVGREGDKSLGETAANN